MIPAFTMCVDCCARAGYISPPHTVAMANAYHALTIKIQWFSPGMLWLEFVDDVIWALCGCGWTPLPIYVVAWEDRQRAENGGLVAALRAAEGDDLGLSP